MACDQIKANDPSCLVVDFNGTVLTGLAQDEDVIIDIVPINEADEVSFGTGGCVSVNVKDNTHRYVDITFAPCSGSLAFLRSANTVRNQGYLAIDDVCNGDSFFTNCAMVLTKAGQAFGGNPGTRTIRFLATNVIENDAVFNTETA